MKFKCSRGKTCRFFHDSGKRYGYCYDWGRGGENKRESVDRALSGRRKRVGKEETVFLGNKYRGFLFLKYIFRFIK